MIYYGVGECYLIYRQEVAGLEIRFKGNAEILSNVPNGWLFRAGKNKMIILALQKNVPLDKLLFTYEGRIFIKSVRVTNWGLRQNRLPITLQGTYQPEKIDSFPETVDLKPEKLSGTLDHNPKKKKIRKTKIIGRVK
tara:strand:+ start:120 stop:530 length:411 start_codon:yes stop_codon:yes gene_type:complete